MTLTRSNPRAKPRWALLAALVATVTLVLATGSLAVHDVDLFELDKDAAGDTRTTPVGYIVANLTSSATSIDVCQTATGAEVPPNPIPATGDIILIEAERMEIVTNGAGSFGGNCAGAKKTYTVLRAQGTPATAHAGGAQKIEARVSLIIEADTAGLDWDQVYDANEADADTDCSAIDTSLEIVECTFVEDGIGPSIYTIGSTKDHLPIEGWFHTSGASPDKGEILNAFAAKALDGEDELLYFGMDRYAVDGSTDIGFWFFQDLVVACPDANAPEGTCDGVPDGEFAGSHVEDDILILGTFTQGGATSNIRVFTWVDEGGDPGNINGPTGAFGDCVPGSDDDSGCATVNNTSIEVPWTYTFKGSAKGGWVPAGGAFEGGVNLTALGLEGCFSSFLAETRSSPEVTAILKDFALGQFESCDTELVTTPSDSGGTALPDSDDEDLLREISIGTGLATVTDSAQLDVKGIGDWEGTLDFYLCGPAATTCDDTGTLVSSHAVTEETTQPVVSDTATVSSVGVYCWAGIFTSGTDGVPNAEDVSPGECFEVLPVPTQISTVATTAVKIGDPIDDTATLAGAATQPGDPIIDGPAGAAANGTITFTAYGPHTDADTCTTVAYTSVVTVAGNGSYVASDGDADGDDTPGEAEDAFVPTQPGYYNWVAVYSGDPPNTDGVSGECGDDNEVSEVVDAYITISPLQDTNESGDTHVLTATVTQIDGTGESAAPDGTVVSFSLSNNDAGADFIDDGADSDGDLIEGNDCVTSGGVGQCSVSITTTGTGDVDIDAATTFSVSGVSLTRSTDGTGSNSDNANKIFVDASIALSPLDDTNNINSQHVFTVTVTLLPLGTVTEDLVITPSINPTPDEYATTCTTPPGPGPVETGTDTDVYTCTVTINHGSAEEFTLNASLSVTLDGLAVTRDTDPATTEVGAGPAGTGPATKEFVDGSLAWIKHDQDGELLAGATFEVCQTHYLDTSGTPHVLVLLVDDSTPPEPAPECVSVIDDDGSDPAYAGLDEDPDGGEFLLTGLELGTWTIRETAAPEGYAFDDTVIQTVEITLADRTGTAATAFVNERLYKLIVITCNESTNQLVISEVDLAGNVKDTFGGVPSSWGDVTEADICGLGDDAGAVYGGLDAGTFDPSVTIPKPAPPAE